MEIPDKVSNFSHWSVFLQRLNCSQKSNCTEKSNFSQQSNFSRWSIFSQRTNLSLNFRSMRVILALGLLLLLAATTPFSSGAAKANWHPSQGQELLGSLAPEFRGLSWVQGGPIRLQQQRGKVVLIRFWLAGCPLCENSAAALNFLDKKYGKAGLVVIGIHHPKSEAVKSAEVVLDAAHKLGFNFAIAQDNDWQTINALWLGNAKRKFTSATLLIDKNGRICWVHDGGTLRMTGDGSAAYTSLDAKIRALLESP
jgi:peroxiredoxin